MINKDIFKKGIALGAIVLFILTCTIPIVNGNEESTGGGFIPQLRGGIGAVALIDTYYAGDCFEEVPVNYYITIEGNGVIHGGTHSGTVPGMTRTFVRTIFAFGFGPVSIICKVTNHGKMLETKTKSGFMIGFIVLAL